MVSLRTKTAPGDCVSVAVASSGEYGAPEGLQFGFPVVSDGQGNWSVAEGFEHDDFARERIAVTTEELMGERNDVPGARPHRAEPGGVAATGTPMRHRPFAPVKPPRNTRL